MSEDELRERIFQILHRIAPEANLHELDPNQNLRESLDIDSFDFLNVVIGISETFAVSIPEVDYRQVSTLRGMMDYINKRMPSTPAKR
jgi:acyl carrier protein